MAIPSKAIILKIDTDLSHEYAATCAMSCDKIGLENEFFYGYQEMTAEEAWLSTKINFRHDANKRPVEKMQNYKGQKVNKAECCSASHANIWKKIADGPDEAVIILEHDSIMLQPVTIDIPEDCIVVLGYKLTDPNKYDHVKAGNPSKLSKINGHEGAHAYAITKNTAKKLIEEIEQRGILGCVDNAYFLKTRKTLLPLFIMTPTPAIGWIRSSSIWDTSSTRNYDFVQDFKLYLSNL